MLFTKRLKKVKYAKAKTIKYQHVVEKSQIHFSIHQIIQSKAVLNKNIFNIFLFLTSSKLVCSQA